MRWGTYFAVSGAVISIGLALGVTMPLVSLRLESWGYDAFAIGVMAATPAVGVLLGASLAGRLAARFGTTVLMQLCLLLGAVSVAGLALVGAFSGSAVAAFREPETREAAAITFLITASGLSFGGISGAFWGLIGGGLMMALQRVVKRG